MVSMGMPVTADGRVEVTAALNWIESHIDSSHHDAAARRQVSGPAAPAPAPAPAPAAGGIVDAGRVLLTAKAKRALVDLRRAEREERRENGELVEVAEVRRAVEGMVANAKAKLLALGHRIGPRVAIESDAGKCGQIIDDVVGEALLDLTGYEVLPE